MPETQSCANCFADRPLSEYQGEETRCYECRLKGLRGSAVAAAVPARAARAKALLRARDYALSTLRQRHPEEYEQLYLGEVERLGYDPQTVVKNRHRPVGEPRKPRNP